MPELPEVETIVQDLKTKVSGHKILDIDSDWPKIIKEPKYSLFKKQLIGLIIENIERRGKNIIFNLTQDKALILHLRMTGHPLVTTCWEFKKGKLKKKDLEECKKEDDPIENDPQNRFVHVSFSLDKGKNLLLSDVRKFATLRLVDNSRLQNIFKSLGPDALNSKLTLAVFKKMVKNEKRSIKTMLLDQEIIAGIGNIYSDEILFEAKINPKKRVNQLDSKEFKKIYEAMKKTLIKAVELRGTSISDYRDTAGEKGRFGDIRKVYKKEGQPCPKKCGGNVKRDKIGGRSAFYCPNCQKGI